MSEAAEPGESAERRFRCPYCGERISFVLDLSSSPQEYVEDCEVCCRPIQVRFTVEAGAVAGFEAGRAQ